MDAPTPPDSDRFGFRSRRVSWALGISLVVHVVLIDSALRYTPARAAVPSPTPAPFNFEPTPTPRPLVIATKPPPPTPVPTQPPRIAPTPPPLASRVVHVKNAPAPRRVAHLDAPHLRDPLQDPAKWATGSRGGPPGDPGPLSGNGTGPGTATGLPAPVEPVASATPAPTFAPKPSCATPNAPAHPLSVVQPDESDEAKERGETGTVRIRITLDPRGTILASTVDTSSGYPDLDRAALLAAQQSRFAPETQDCEAVGGSYLFVASFEE